MAEFIYPVDLPISSSFGPREGGFHPGVDLSDGIPGHPIRAAADGPVVYKAFEEGGLGNTVTLVHGGVKSGYGHMLGAAVVEVGDVVRQGDILGFVGTTGASTGPHLHFWMGENPNVGAVDPMQFIEHGDPLWWPSPAPVREEDDMPRDFISPPDGTVVVFEKAGNTRRKIRDSEWADIVNGYKLFGLTPPVRKAAQDEWDSLPDIELLPIIAGKVGYNPFEK